MKKTKAAGDRRERQVRVLLEDDGWIVQKARVSFGPADLVARKDNIKMLVQVKANKGSPWKSFTPDERQELQKEADLASAIAVLAHWPPYESLTWYYEQDWPK